MLEMFQLPFMCQAFVVCLLLTVILSYFGIHVIRRGIVFIDLALAQISSVGVAFATLTGGDPRVYAILFTLIGALALSLIPNNSKRIPQEAIIGIIYAFAAALSILIMAKTPHGDSDVTEILFGNILAIQSAQITEIAITFALVGLFHLLFYKKFYTLSFQSSSSQSSEVKIDSTSKVSSLNLWNTLFYISMALVISSAIGATGVLQAFSYLIVPAVCGLLLCKKFWAAFGIALAVSLGSSLTGLYFSYSLDLPTGASIVCCFGLFFLLILTIMTIGGIPALQNKRLRLDQNQ